MLFFVTLHLQQVRGWSPVATGLGFLPVLVAIVVAAAVVGSRAWPLRHARS